MGFMEQILIKDIKLPDWSLKDINLEQFKKLSQSIKKNGQTKNIIVRKLDIDKYEVIDGKNVFKILKTLNKDYVHCYVYRDISKLESLLIYLEHDFYFENDFIKISEAIEKIHKKVTKYEISKYTKYSYNEILELLTLANFDFSRFKIDDEPEQMNIF